MTWIKLAIHPEHDKVLRLADLTGQGIHICFTAAIRWFWWVDAHVDGASTAVSYSGFRVVTQWPDDGLAKAMLHADVDWLAEADGMLRPTRPDSHFGKSARRRALDAVRKTSARHADESRTVCGARPDQTRPEKTDTSGLVHTSVLSVVSGVAGWPEWDARGISAITGGDVRGVLAFIGLREPLLSATCDLPDLTTEEIARVAKDVGTDGTVEQPLRKAVIVADRLFRTRKLERPTTKRGGKERTLAESLPPELNGLANIRRNRGYP